MQVFVYKKNRRAIKPVGKKSDLSKALYVRIAMRYASIEVALKVSVPLVEKVK